jgi:5-(carboxyamino)imidazole ribonucleotide mutase
VPDDPPQNQLDLQPASAAQYGSTMTKELRPQVGIIMGSKSDWDTLSHAHEMLDRFGVAHECRVVSAHRTPEWMCEYAREAESRGLQVIIAGAGGAAHLPGMVAAQTILPVLGVPVQSQSLQGLDSLLSIVQMPGGVPVATLAIGKAGAINAALLAVSILARSHAELGDKLRTFRDEQRRKVLGETLP